MCKIDVWQFSRKKSIPFRCKNKHKTRSWRSVFLDQVFSPYHLPLFDCPIHNGTIVANKGSTRKNQKYKPCEWNSLIKQFILFRSTKVKNAAFHPFLKCLLLTVHLIQQQSFQSSRKRKCAAIKQTMRAIKRRSKEVTSQQCSMARVKHKQKGKPKVKRATQAKMGNRKDKATFRLLTISNPKHNKRGQQSCMLLCYAQYNETASVPDALKKCWWALMTLLLRIFLEKDEK